MEQVCIPHSVRLGTRARGCVSASRHEEVVSRHEQVVLWCQQPPQPCLLPIAAILEFDLVGANAKPKCRKRADLAGPTRSTAVERNHRLVSTLN